MRDFQAVEGRSLRFRNPPRWRSGHGLGACVRLLAAIACLYPRAGLAQSLEDLGRMSIEDLSDIEVTSVSKRPEPVSQAPASVYVLTNDDIAQSGATSLPEMLRMAPNLEVAQISPSDYAISSRGLLGNVADQNFPNKLLVLIDGRSVYSPLYSGVYWDVQDLVPEDIERIEVISGPGATLWGANAMNGVINITTRKSADTQGGLLDVEAGNLESGVTLRYGGALDDDLTGRVYGRAIVRNALDTSDGGNAHDGWSKPQGGFRLDWTPSGDAVTLQGDLYKGDESQLNAPDQLVAGGDLLARWAHDLAGGSTLQLQAYYDQTDRSTDNGGGSFALRTYDLDVQHSVSLAGWNDIVWGAGDRVSAYRIAGRLSNTTSLLFAPASRTLNLANAFIQDRIALTDPLSLTVGLKLEDDPYSGLSPLPDIRLSWQVNADDMLWAAISRAIRSPTPFDRDVVEKLGRFAFLTGGADFQPETLIAYQLGYRAALSRRASLSITGYMDDYDRLKSIEFTAGDRFPLVWGNMMEGDVYGVEAWAGYQISDWWRLTAGFSIQHEALRFRPGASQFLGVAQAGDDPRHQASLRSSMTLGGGVVLETDLRYVGVLPNPKVPDYGEMNVRLGWRVARNLDVSLSGLNLLHPRHQEFTIPGSDLVRRSFVLDAQWKF